MADPVFLPLEHEDVISYMGACWPPRPNAPCLLLPPETGITDGAAIVYPIDGQPGYCWWVIDSTIYVQDAGTPDEQLAALLPGSQLGSVPDPNSASDTPPEG